MKNSSSLTKPIRPVLWHQFFDRIWCLFNPKIWNPLPK
ncbi:hypothetical protein ERO13_A03G092650v2 [Gossypium hirsutum]|nr:hypothetical protein ERO13_A03G092650v2 [Gossypium hirsutum]